MENRCMYHRVKWPGYIVVVSMHSIAQLVDKFTRNLRPKGYIVRIVITFVRSKGLLLLVFVIAYVPLRI